jgi:hypothetical protein
MASKSEIASPWYRYGTDKHYQAWCRKQPCAVTGAVGNVVYAHYRTAANSGIAIKPVYSGVPMDAETHRLQHQIGQYALKSRIWWEQTVEKHLRAWAKARKNAGQD